MSALADFHPEGWLGQPFHYVRQTGSTNDLAYEAGLNGDPEGTLYITDEQVAGRGRFDRTWSAPSGCCLLSSIMLRPQAPFAYRASRITMACGLAMQRAIVQVSGVPARLKWPNDVIVETDHGFGKLAGMLSEIGLVEQQPAFIVVGIGVNVNIPAQSLHELSTVAMSLSVAAGHTVSRRDLLAAFLDECESLIEAIRQGEEILSLWRDGLAWLGQSVSIVQAAGEHIHGTFVGVTEQGHLLVAMPSGEMRTFSAGDISLRPA